MLAHPIQVLSLFVELIRLKCSFQYVYTDGIAICLSVRCFVDPDFIASSAQVDRRPALAPVARFVAAVHGAHVAVLCIDEANAKLACGSIFYQIDFLPGVAAIGDPGDSQHLEPLDSSGNRRWTGGCCVLVGVIHQCVSEPSARV